MQQQYRHSKSSTHSTDSQLNLTIAIFYLVLSSDVMIPELPKSVTQLDALAFYSDLLSNLEDQSTIHTNWHTHKQNPAVCWICDIPICARKIAYLTEQILTKSPVDMETVENSDNDSELEIEDESSNDDRESYNEPEYDVINDDMESEV